MADSNVSKLPTSMQVKKEELSKPANTEEGNSEVDKKNIPDPVPGDKVTLSRDEFNSLQAAKDRLATAEGRMSAQQDDLQALQTRLTELEAGAKGSGEGRSAPAPAPAPSAIQADLPQVDLTDKEKEDFEEDTISLMQKIANNIFSARAASLLEKVNEKLVEVESVSNNAATSARQIQTDTFTESVKDKVKEFGDFEAIVRHQHWPAFLDSVEDISGTQYRDLITDNVRKKNLGGMTQIFKRFHEKYIQNASAKVEGYQGAMPSGNSDVSTEGTGKEVLKLSDRQALHKQYINKEIGYDDYQKQKEKYTIADSEGRLDYNS